MSIEQAGGRERHTCHALPGSTFSMNIHVAGFSGCCARTDEGRAVWELLKDPDRFFNRNDAVMIKSSATASSMLLPGIGGSTGVYLKCYNSRGVFHALSFWFRPSRARRVWLCSKAMVNAGLATPRPILYLEQRRFGTVRRSWVVTEYITDAEPLTAFFERCYVGSPRDVQKSIIAELAAHTRRMHACGVAHGDYKASNILVQQTAETGRRFYSVDLDAANAGGRISEARAFKDLARLNCSFLHRGRLSTTMRLWFLKCYMGAQSRDGLRGAWKTVSRLTRHKLRKSGRRFG